MNYLKIFKFDRMKQTLFLSLSILLIFNSCNYVVKNDIGKKLDVISKNLNQYCPVIIDSDVTLDYTNVIGNDFFGFSYTVKSEYSNEWRTNKNQELKKLYCTSSDTTLNWFKENDINLYYGYDFSDTTIIITVFHFDCE